MAWMQMPISHQRQAHLTASRRLNLSEPEPAMLEPMTEPTARAVPIAPCSTPRGVDVLVILRSTKDRGHKGGTKTEANVTWRIGNSVRKTVGSYSMSLIVETKARMYTSYIFENSIMATGRRPNLCSYFRTSTNDLLDQQDQW